MVHVNLIERIMHDACLVSKLNSLKGEINAKRVTIRGSIGDGNEGTAERKRREGKISERR